MNPLPLVAVAGNPNAGKSALFNALTGARPFNQLGKRAVAVWTHHELHVPRAIEEPLTHPLRHASRDAEHGVDRERMRLEDDPHDVGHSTSSRRAFGR